MADWIKALANFVAHSLLAMILLTASAQAQSLFERLVLPGDLTSSHSELQKDCANCHDDFKKGAQVGLCLDCHKDVSGDLKTASGFHGRSAEAQASECDHCHTDHKGRDFQIALLDRETFDHDQTDFRLDGAHMRVACENCHQSSEPFRKAASQCFDCHRNEDRHDGKLGKDCANCHKSTGWADVSTFDHSKTDFPLTNAHKTVSCVACHAGEAYEDLPVKCVGCHRIQDVHEDRFGAKCETCHVNTKWSEVRFDHGLDTDFRLEGAHKTAQCDDCHAENVFTHPQASDCASCHRPDDTHRGELGINCADCHSSSGWLKDVYFDHDFTDFPLIGQHRVVPCEGCHIDTTFQIAQSDCVSCHTSDDAHRSKLGPECETCHNPNGWAFWLFDHNAQTRFSLTGAHAAQKCENCHAQPVNDRPLLSRSCLSCHRSDDVHKGTFGAQCSACHSTATFKGARLK